MLALIDESAPPSALGVHYVIGAAVLLDGAQEPEARARAAKLLGGRGRPFHWRDEGAEKRAAMIELLGELDVGVFATIHRPVAARRQEHARRRSLTDLLEILSREGVDEVLIESRGVQDQADRRTIIAATEMQICRADLRYAFGKKQDPLLWLPDAVAGVLAEAECRRSDQWVAELQRTIAIFEVRRLDAHEPRLPS